MTDAGDRLRCWALGVRVREQTDAIVTNARELSHPMGKGERGHRQALLKTQMGLLDQLLADSKGCGVGGPVLGDFGVLEVLVQGGSGDSAVAMKAGDLSLDVHTVASEHAESGSVFGPTEGGSVNEEGIVPGEYTSYHRAMIGGDTPPGKYAFIDAERWWASHDNNDRRMLLSDLFDLSAEEDDEMSKRPYGALDGDTQDALEGEFTRRAREHVDGR